jgi:hypothetical protein
MRKERGKLRLIIVDKNRSVLKERAIRSPLRAPGELPLVVEDNLSQRRMVKTGKHSWWTVTPLDASGVRCPVSRDNLRADAKTAQAREQETIDAIIRFVQITSGSHRRGDRVRHLTMMENCPATSRSSHDTDAPLGEGVEIVASASDLIAAERYRRRTPGVNAERPFVGRAGATHECFIERHVPRAVSGRRYQETPHCS